MPRTENNNVAARAEAPCSRTMEAKTNLVQALKRRVQKLLDYRCSLFPNPRPHRNKSCWDFTYHNKNTAFRFLAAGLLAEN